MPAQIPRPEIMDEDQLMKEVLDKFVNCHEQTYEEFLSTFTYLSKEDNVAKGGTHGTDSSKNIFPVEKWTQKNESNGHHFRNTTSFLHTSSEGSEEDQIVIDEGQKVSSSFQGDMNRAGKVKVDNFIDLEALESEEESKSRMNQDRLLLPGEAEQAIPTCVPYAPSVDLPLTSEVKLKPALRRTQKQAEEIVGDEVQPFFLDEEFDYDNVTLTPKFTAGDIGTIQELSKQKRMDTSADLCEPPD
ncbi:intraflagellar transport-associated protein [Psammomys obesus]|uniref:intraflagellar transport-associated protein n=1 Tax=Psammomys obesus TaxID=48139 RepID=UPI002452C470|nr:intraflagellar transport-associated protein [Psammomys obesus]XP_055460263.1 intraflagellar transport-associated protein [Psammomys obesus]